MSVVEEVISLAKQAREQNRKLVLATGVFDVLHEAHRGFLRAAKAVGDVLIVGLESDKRVRKIKGEGRPINSAMTRKTNLEAWHLADMVFVLPEDFHLPHRRVELISLLRPHVLAVSSHTEHLEEKSRIVQQYGGELKVVYEHDPSVSTSQLINGQRSE